MDAHEFLDALVASIGDALPEGIEVTANHDFAGITEFDRARRDEHDEYWKQVQAEGDPGPVWGRLTHFSEGDVLPRTTQLRQAGVVPTELVFSSSGSWSGSYLDSFLGTTGDHQDDEVRADLPADNLLAAALYALSDLQDFVCEVTHEPWPNVGVAAVPQPGGRLEGDRILLWFGDEADPVCRLSPMVMG